MIRRARGSLREGGLRITITKPYIILLDYFYDFVHRLDTTRWVYASDGQADYGSLVGARPYQPTRVWPLRRLLRKLVDSFPEERVLVDFGCGKARVLIIASEFGFHAARGVEVSGQLCEIARQNCDRHQKAVTTTTRFEVIQQDAAEYRIRDDENIFFMFNPFDRSTLGSVLANISDSLKSAPRTIFIIFNNIQFPDVLESAGFLPFKTELSFGGHKFTIYSQSQAPI